MENKSITEEQKLLQEHQKLVNEKLQRVSKQITDILNQEGLTMEIDHIIKIVPKK